MKQIVSSALSFLSLRNIAFCASLGIASTSTVCADTLFSFNIPSSSGIPVQAYENRSNSYDFYTDYNEAVRWNIGWNRIAGAWGKNNPSTTGTKQFLYRNLNDGGILSAGESLLNPTVSIGRNSWTWGGAVAQYSGYLGFLDNSGNGYILSFDRTGAVAFYEIESGIHSEWTLKGSTILTGLAQASGIDGYQDVSFTASRDQLSFVITQGLESVDGVYNLAGTDTRYDMTTIVVGAKMAADEEFIFRSIEVNGAVIPESSTYALIFGASAVLIIAMRRRMRSQRS